MKIEDLEAFVAVVRAQSLSAAADMLALTQPSITRRVQNLEESLGVELLDRSVKPPRPNAMGRQVHEQCRAVMRELAILREVVALDTRPSGKLRLGLTQGLGELLLPRAMADLRGAAPELAVQVFTGWTSDVVSRLEHDEVDGAVVLLPAAYKIAAALQGDVLGSVRLVVVGARDPAAAASAPNVNAGAVAAPRRARWRLADCAAQGWVLNPEGCGFRAALQRALAEQGLALDIRLETFGRELQLQLVADGLGLALVPEPMFEASAWRDRLEVLYVVDFRPVVELWVLRARALGKFDAALAGFARSVAVALGLARTVAATGTQRKATRAAGVRSARGAGADVATRGGPPSTPRRQRT